MPLEKFFSGEQPINVKDLTIENPEKEEPWFDPEKEMTEEAWGKIKRFLENGTLEESTPNAAMLMQAYPEKAQQFGAETVAERLEKRGEVTLDECKRIYPAGPVGPSTVEIGILYGMKVLRPELFNELATPDSMKYCATAVSKKSKGIVSLSSPYVFRDVFIARMFMPQEKVRVESTRKELDRFRENGLWEIFMTRAAAARLFSPETFAELGIDEGAQKNMKEEFWKKREETLREKSHRVIPPYEETSEQILLNEAVALKILAAEEIKFKEDGGFELIMRKEKPDLESKTPPMPEKRNF